MTAQKTQTKKPAGKPARPAGCFTLGLLALTSRILDLLCQQLAPGLVGPRTFGLVANIVVVAERPAAAAATNRQSCLRIVSRFRRGVGVGFRRRVGVTAGWCRILCGGGRWRRLMSGRGTRFGFFVASPASHETGTNQKR